MSFGLLTDPIFWLDFAGRFLFIAGFVVGLGAVTVIDVHGFLARKSRYWTEATTRAHKVTKPLIWLGTGLAVLGAAIMYRAEPFLGIPALHAALFGALVANGLFLSFRISPYLLKREKEGASDELLPKRIQKRIVASFLVSFIGWWSAVALFVLYVMTA